MVDIATVIQLPMVDIATVIQLPMEVAAKEEAAIQVVTQPAR